MAKEMEFRELMALAKDVLENDTPYYRNRNVIDALFKLKPDLPYQEIVYVRLAVIDSFYSTNMKKHIGGMDELAKVIADMSEDDDDLKKKISQYKMSLNQPDITDLFEKSFGSPSAKELSHIQLHSKEIVLTRSAAISYFGTDDVVGKHVQNMVNNTLDELTVAGVVEDIRVSPARALRSLLFSPSDLHVYNIYFAIRLKKGINPKRFVEEHGKELIAQGKTDYCRIRRLMTFNEHLQQMELDEGRPQEVNRSLTLALFFLVNLCVCCSHSSRTVL